MKQKCSKAVLLCLDNHNICAACTFCRKR